MLLSLTPAVSLINSSEEIFPGEGLDVSATVQGETTCFDEAERIS